MKKKVALVGYGYWGPNLLRNMFANSDCEVVYCCDKDRKRLRLVQERYPTVEATTNFSKILSDSKIDAVVLATPTITHYHLAKKAIEAGKDVLIEKPVTVTARQARSLVSLAKKHKRVVLVDQVFLFSDAVMLVKKIIENGEIGDILYIDSVRANLGLFQKDLNVIFDLATHDFSIIQYLLDTHPRTIQAHANTHFGSHEDVAYIFAEYHKGISAHINVSWLSPVKIRRMLIVGTKKMIVYDDIEPTEKVRIYDKGVVVERSPKEVEATKIDYRSGDVWLPKVKIVEPLSTLVADFITALNTRKVEKSDGEFAARITEILEGATKSAKTGRRVTFKNANK